MADFTYQYAERYLKLLAMCKNNWRRRHIKLYQHPKDPSLVVSVGIPYNGSSPPVVCVEPRSLWIGVLENGITELN